MKLEGILWFWFGSLLFFKLESGILWEVVNVMLFGLLKLESLKMNLLVWVLSNFKFRLEPLVPVLVNFKNLTEPTGRF